MFHFRQKHRLKMVGVIFVKLYKLYMETIDYAIIPTILLYLPRFIFKHEWFLLSAPPNFIERLHPYFGARWNDQYINLTCRVECSPLCSISWTKNGRPIERSVAGRYDIKEVVERANPTANIFESVRSTLLWNMSAWPNSQLDRLLDNANYSCHSSGNLVGPGVNSTTTFGVECE